ncbi:hypothetical protein VE26_06330 [Devosia chinhatensis]|uniref:Peptidase M15C domain-containing protein n=2 Tax=Devosia chinhatensis TaxID=429727 RepID=A0A0F5FKX8_9HYPH|nr:hypothetical protein VE26_06330 [Devosia chinhatensis]
MVDRPFLQSQRYADQQKRAKLEGAHPDIVEFVRVLPKRMAKHGVPMFASEVWRSDERQNQLFEQGFSKARAGQGPHPFGCAADLVHGVRGWNLNRDQWRLVGHIGQELVTQKGLNLVWGGNWPDFYDPAHWQVADWKVQAADFPFPRIEKWERNWKKRLEAALAQQATLAAK